MKILIIPTLNERKNILNLFKKIKSFNYKLDFLFIDDNSTDGTREQILKFCKKNKNSYAYKFMGTQKYLSCMKICDVVIGNSSSGILEAPTLKIPSINIGDRQKGRIQAISVINSDYSYKKIYASIKKSLSTDFKKKIKKTKNPYYKKNTALNIAKIIEKKINIKELRLKEFYDIKQ